MEPRWRSNVELLAAFAMMAASGAMIYASLRRPAPPPAPTRSSIVLPDGPISIPDVARKGSPSAPIVLLEYSDFQCPVCERFASTVLPQFLEEFVEAGKVQLLYRHLPLERLHPMAMKAAEAAECAHRQGRFWAMHDLVFARQDRLAADALVDWAGEIGLDQQAFGACFAGLATERVRMPRRRGPWASPARRRSL
jgi:hypothetical protein